MSSNNFFLLKDSMSFYLYKSLVDRFKVAKNNQATLEDTVESENQYISYVKDVMLKPYTQIKTLSEFDILDMEGHGYNIKYVNRKFILNISAIAFLEKNFSILVSDMISLISEVNGKVKRINQKKAALSLWKNDISFVYLEKFLNFDNLKDSYTKGNKMFVDFDQGIALLPVESERRINIKEAIIKKGNGRAGNSDAEVDYSGQILENIFDENYETYFEYEKINGNNLELEIELQLYSKSIINKIEVWPFIEEGYLGYEIEDITFFKEKSNEVSIFDLCDLKNIYVKNDSEKEFISIDFLPVECISLRIKFKQSKKTNITRRRRLRNRVNKRMAIGIKEICLKSKKYSTIGEISSRNVAIPMPVFIGKSQLNIYPKIQDLYKVDLNINGGEGWKVLNINKDLSSEEFLMDGDESSFDWKLYLEKKSNEFKNKSSYEEVLSSLETETKQYNKKVNPCIVTYKGQVKEENISVFSETGIAKTNDRKNFKILKSIKTDSLKFNIMIDGVEASPDGSIIKIALPLSLRENKIEPEEIGIIVNGAEYTNVFSWEDLNKYNFFVSYKDNSIWFNNTFFPGRGRVQWYLKPEELRFKSDSDYFYSKFNFYPNPNKKDIRITNLSSYEKQDSVIIKPNVDKVFLKDGVIEDSIELKSNSITFEERTSLKQLEAYNGNNIAYFFEEEGSVVYFSKKIDVRGIHKVSFKIKEKRISKSSQYEIWEVDSVPMGIKIKKENFKSEVVKQKLFSSMKGYYDLKNNKIETRSGLFNSSENKSFVLRHPNVIEGSVRVKKNLNSKSQSKYEEVTFLDGESEFLNLIYVEDEKTNKISGSNNIITFSIAARNLFYKKLGITFEENDYFLEEVQNSTDVTSNGKYHINESGEVTLYLDSNELNSNVKYSYYYESGDISQHNKYSVDYESSIIYFSEEVDNTNSFIEYRIANYIAEYDILSKIEDYKVSFEDNKVMINSSEFPNNRGKVFVFYKSSLGGNNLENIVEYFSPIVYSFRVDFK